MIFTQIILTANLLFWLVYQVKINKLTGKLEFTHNKKLLKDLKNFLRKQPHVLERELCQIKKFINLCHDYQIIQEMKEYIRTTEDDKMNMQAFFAHMIDKLKCNKYGIENFLLCFTETSSIDGCLHFSPKLIREDYYMFEHMYGKQLLIINEIIAFFNKHEKKFQEWYEQTPAMIDVFSPDDRKYIEWWSSKENYAFYYSKMKERYLVKTREEQEKTVKYLEPPLEKTEDKPTEWSDDSGTEEEYDGYRWRDRDLCSKEPHYCKCYICVLNSLLSCKCSVCLQKRAVNFEILARKQCD